MIVVEAVVERPMLRAKGLVRFVPLGAVKVVTLHRRVRRTAKTTVRLAVWLGVRAERNERQRHWHQQETSTQNARRARHVSLRVR